MMIVAIITFPGSGRGTCAFLAWSARWCEISHVPAAYQPGHTFLCMYEQAISNVSGEEVSGMTITTRNLHGACRTPFAPVLRTPSRRLSAVHGRVKAPCRSMAAVHQTTIALIPVIVIG
jgi:hypothetical protein